MGGTYTVTEINTYIKNMFARDYALANIRIKGEISNLKYHSSGHIYFTLKDEGAAINAVMFASHRAGLTFRMQEGQSVEARGQISVYEKAGSYQLYAREIKLSGRGELYERFESLKRELFEMGMFDEGYKKPVPRYALNIGVVTSETGAAIRDILNIAGRRNPYVKIFLYPALVQGEEAKFSIVKGIKTLDRLGLDVLIVGRGGGSIEDLWAFNEEIVARAIFDADTPVISAVGHEVDTTIADYVADLRAPTPSAAAELAVFDYAAFEEELSSIEVTLRRQFMRRLDRARAGLEGRKLKLSLKSPERLLSDRKKRLCDIKRELDEITDNNIRASYDRLSAFKRSADACVRENLTDKRHKMVLFSKRLELLSPLLRISGGYGYLVDSKGKSIKSVDDISKNEKIKTYIRDGVIVSVVEAAEKSRGF